MLGNRESGPGIGQGLGSPFRAPRTPGSDGGKKAFHDRRMSASSPIIVSVIAVWEIGRWSSILRHVFHLIFFYETIG